MDLNKKPLYVLRNLAERLDIPSATSYTKDDLIQKINKRKTEIENGEPVSKKSNFGRPKLNPCFIGIKKDENGKLIFYDIDFSERDATVSRTVSEETEKIKAAKEKDRKKERARLKETKKILEGIIALIDYYTEG
ncbi:MAG: Rho termination factor N-terminal domain-containing protein [Clostridia bacterium]|nr:Rho termination factor N-terminal domain-containing protein [Clostridia bacterium]